MIARDVTLVHDEVQSWNIDMKQPDFVSFERFNGQQCQHIEDSVDPSRSINSFRRPTPGGLPQHPEPSRPGTIDVGGKVGLIDH